MPVLRTESASCSAADLRVAIAVSQWHPEITTSLLQGATEAFEECGGRPEHLAIGRCPGAWELITTAVALSKLEPTPHAIVALGCVIHGETDHDRWIIGAVSNALAMLGVQTGLPIGFGLLTCSDEDQARARAGGVRGNKGREAMMAAIEQAATLSGLSWTHGE